MKLEKTAVTEWPVANVGHTQANSNASVRRAIMGKVCSMNAQVSLHLGSSIPVTGCRVTNEPATLQFQKWFWLLLSLLGNSFGLRYSVISYKVVRILNGFSEMFRHLLTVD